MSVPSPLEGFDLEPRLGGSSSWLRTPQGRCHSTVMAEVHVRGADGQVHSEKYRGSKVVDGAKAMAEGQELYANSSGVEKMAHERHIGARGRKIVRERNRESQEETTQDLQRGLEGDGALDQFDQDWERDARPALKTLWGRRGEPLPLRDFVDFERQMGTLGLENVPATALEGEVEMEKEKEKTPSPQRKRRETAQSRAKAIRH